MTSHDLGGIARVVDGKCGFELYVGGGLGAVPHQAKLAEKLAASEGLLLRRATFNGRWEQLTLDALMEVRGAQIAFSPGLR